MDGSGSNLTIDFSDASFDNSSDNEQPIPGVDNIDVVFPLDDNPEITVGSGEHEKNSFRPPRTRVWKRKVQVESLKRNKCTIHNPRFRHRARATV